MRESRFRIRQAQRLQDAWAKAQQESDSTSQPWHHAHRCWVNLTVINRQIELARERGFVHALRSMHDDFRWKLDELVRYLQLLRDVHNQPVQKPSLADWFCELQSLDEEFGNLAVDFKQNIVRVTTEPIRLKDVALGPFSIELHWSRFGVLKGSSCFDVVAVVPNPASGREEVAHPHVNDGDLCAGDAQKPIEMALAEGRISEAFLLIRSVLVTYNPRSAYVQLEEWDGLFCGDCGGRVRREFASYCEGCQSELCDGCTSSCRSCEETRCGGCLNACDGCSDHCCSRCLETIANDTSLCSSCRGICGNCNTVLLNSELDDDGHCPECAVPEVPQPSTPLEESHAS